MIGLTAPKPDQAASPTADGHVACGPENSGGAVARQAGARAWVPGQHATSGIWPQFREASRPARAHLYL
jgi:hypothetical protein